MLVVIGPTGNVGAEVAQLFARGRTFDVTDMLVQVAGVLVGWAIVRRADVRRDRLAARRPRAGGGAATPTQSALGYVSGGSSAGCAAPRSSGETARVSSKW